MCPFFHGTHKNNFYFEGWFFKQRAEKAAVAFIPGISMDKDGNKAAFIQVNTDKKSYYFEFPFETFSAKRDVLSIRIGRNTFLDNGVHIDIDKDGTKIEGDIAFGALTPISYNIMGPFAHVPLMQCKHGIISMCHTTDGSIAINDEDFVIRNELGYIETDWGDSFPKEYLWTQGCEFSEDDPTECDSFFVSIADIPMLGTAFTGCIASIYHKDKHMRLATYLGAKIKHWDEDGLEIVQGKYRLSVNVLPHEAQALLAPVNGSMNRVIKENNACPVDYELFKDGVCIASLHSKRASFEYARV